LKLLTLHSTAPLRYVAVFCSLILATACGRNEFTEREKNILATLSISKLIPASAESNRVAFNEQAQKFGEQLFHETQLSASNKFSCASCHLPDKFFTDGLPTGMAGDRVAVTRYIANDSNYRSQYETVFGTLPFTGNEEILSISATPMGDQKQKSNWSKVTAENQDKINTVFANIGKAMAAYQHTLAPIKTRFDLFIEEVADGKKIRRISSLSKHELEGALLFLNETKTQCLECHNGPLLSNGNFHNIGTGNFTGPIYDFGREFGSQAALLDQFNCQGKYSDAKPEECLHLVYMNRNTAHMRGAFKTPTMRNITNTGPYFHDGRFTTLEQVVRHYANPPESNGADEHELRPGFELTEDEIEALTAFLESFEPAQ